MTEEQTQRHLKTWTEWAESGSILTYPQWLEARIAELEKVVDAKEIVITDLIARIVEAKVLLKTWNDAEFGADLSVEIDILELSNKTEAFLSEEEKT